ncbi:MAG: hypothetical protein BroJett011_04260 [Chloroflexota bacterium]|nr:MAG: hypothetical protein BroJett011_04260 [Chloroflexota bacterium]
MTDLELAQRNWTAALNNLQGQMSPTTFDFCLRSSQVVAAQNGAYQVGIVNPGAVDWLQNREKFRAAIEREIAAVAGVPLSLDFIPLPSTLPPPDEAGQAQPETPSAAAQAVASANYYAGFFEKGGAGFSQTPHHTTYFWQNLLGPAFGLWLILVAEEKHQLTRNPATWWTQPTDRKYVDLARRLNRRHHRYISGDEIECTKSRERRQAGQHLLNPADCCGSPQYDLLRYKSHPKPGCGLLCLHWKAGLLETLARWNLVVVELINGLDAYKFRLQTWRMLPILTPAQVSLFDPHLRDEYRNWLRAYGDKFNIPSVPFWETITEANLVPLMPTHDQPEIVHNFDQRRKRQEFLRHAVSNPRYRQGQESDDEN